MITDSNEQALLKGLAVNDRKAIEAIYKHQYHSIQNLVLNNSGTAEDAKDVFQEALIVLYEKVRAGNFELQCQIKTYLYAVSRRLWLKKLQQMQKLAPELNDFDDTVATETDIELNEKRGREFDLMNEALLELGEPCKSLLESYYLKKKNMVEIAIDFGYTNADNAKNQKYKCLIRLKKLFFDQYKKITHT